MMAFIISLEDVIALGLFLVAGGQLPEKTAYFRMNILETGIDGMAL